ncbi:heterokaryon incompatibility protein-domain-containing protein [Xylariaceae sp. FL1651]|nr:heterokaryon incompatibility protein-domain-containing protein [Xylariaceae sp. FL1651]
MPAKFTHLSFPRESHFTSQLCPECFKIDFDTIFSNTGVFESQINPFSLNHSGLVHIEVDDAFKVPFEQEAERMKKETKSRRRGEGRLVTDLGSRLSKTSPCPLCRFFWYCSPQEATPRPAEYELHAYCQRLTRCLGTSKTKGEGKDEEGRYYVFLSVLLKAEWIDQADIKWKFNLPCLIAPAAPRDAQFPNGCNTHLWGRETSQLANTTLARDWYRTCKSTHEHCQRRSHDSVPEFRGFRLIDCLVNPPVVDTHSWKEEYVALSYVWGIPAVDSHAPGLWPKTVLDAMAVTRELGLRYLWVDKYCIDQGDEEDKALQISHISLIYETAEVTIVATTGETVSSGLAGVHGSMRGAAVKVEISDSMTLVSAHREPNLAIAVSPWATRGWTYQEGLFARRRLYFNDSQMFWQCPGFSAEESFQFPYSRILHGILRFWDDIPSPGWLKTDIGEQARRSILYDCQNHIHEYSKRYFTFDTDVIIAFRSLSSYFCSLSEGDVR